MAIVRVTLDEMMDEAVAKPFPTRDQIIEILRNSPCATEEDLLDPDCPPLTAEQLRHAVPLRIADPEMYAEIEAARARAMARLEEKKRRVVIDGAVDAVDTAETEVRDEMESTTARCEREPCLA